MTCATITSQSTCRQPSRPAYPFLVAPHKCGTKWLRTIFSDPRFLEPDGMMFDSFDASAPLVANRMTFCHIVVAPRLLDYAGATGADFRAVFILRDPRDTCVSAYYSHRFSHELIGGIGNDRRAMANLSARDGMVYIIRRMRELNLFECQRSFVTLRDERVCIIRFEDLIEDNRRWIRTICDHLGVRVRDADLAAVVEANSFSRRRKAPEGVVDPLSHNRRGKAGDWKNHFDPVCVETFLAEAGDLLVTLGYESDNETWTRLPELPACVPEEVDEALVESREWALRVLRMLQLFEGGRIVCYGAGGDFERLVRWMGDRRAGIIGVVDDDASRAGQTLAGCRVYSTADLAELDPDVIAISSRAHGEALYHKARALAGQLPRRAEVWYQP